jgi:hypothetical protein
MARASLETARIIVAERKKGATLKEAVAVANAQEKAKSTQPTTIQPKVTTDSSGRTTIQLGRGESYDSETGIIIPEQKSATGVLPIPIKGQPDTRPQERAYGIAQQNIQLQLYQNKQQQQMISSAPSNAIFTDQTENPLTREQALQQTKSNEANLQTNLSNIQTYKQQGYDITQQKSGEYSFILTPEKQQQLQLEQIAAEDVAYSKIPGGELIIAGKRILGVGLHFPEYLYGLRSQAVGIGYGGSILIAGYPEGKLKEIQNDITIKGQEIWKSLERQDYSGAALKIATSPTMTDIVLPFAAAGALSLAFKGLGLAAGTAVSKAVAGSSSIITKVAAITLPKFASVAPWVVGTTFTSMAGAQVGMTAAYEQKGLIPKDSTALILKKLGMQFSSAALGATYAQGFKLPKPKVEVIAKIGTEGKPQEFSIQKYTEIFGKQIKYGKEIIFKPKVSTGYEPDITTYKGVPINESIIRTTKGIYPGDIKKLDIIEPIPRSSAIVPFVSKLPMVKPFFISIQDLYDITGYKQTIPINVGKIEVQIKGTLKPAIRAYTGYEPDFTIYKGDPIKNALDLYFKKEIIMPIKPGKLAFPFKLHPFLQETFPIFESGIPKYLEGIISIKPKTKTFFDIKKIIEPKETIGIEKTTGDGLKQILFEKPITKVKQILIQEQKQITKPILEKNYLETMLQQNLKYTTLKTGIKLIEQDISFVSSHWIGIKPAISERISIVSPTIKLNSEINLAKASVISSILNTGIISRIEAKQDILQANITKQLLNQIQLPATMQGLKQQSIQELQQKQIQIQLNQQVNTQIQRQLQNQLQQQVQIQDQLQLQELTQQLIQLQELITIPGIVSLTIPVEVGEYQQPGNSFNVLVKNRQYKHGKKVHPTSFRKVTKEPLSQQDAMAFGADIVGHSAKATFKIMPSEKPPSRLTKAVDSWSRVAHQFDIKEDGRIIEKTKYRINTIGELKEITFKGIEARRKRKWR